MSLEKAIIAIAEQMDGEASADMDTMMEYKFRSFARQLRNAVEASKGDQSEVPIDARTRGFMDQAVARLKDRQLGEAKESPSGFSVAELVGGSDEGDLIQIDPAMPVGAKMLQPDGVYVLQQDRKLHFSREDTDRFMEQRK